MICKNPFSSRWKSNTRQEKKRDFSNQEKPLTRHAYRNSQVLAKKHTGVTKSTHQSLNKGSKESLCLDKAKKTCFGNSLLIEAFSAVPKTKKLNPIREKLIRLFRSESKGSSGGKAVIHYQISDQIPKEDIDTPSPIIKPKYLI